MTQLQFQPLIPEEIIEVSAEARYNHNTQVLKVYLNEPIGFLPEEIEALREQWEELLNIFPQLTEHGFSKVKLSRIDGEMFRKPWFDWGIRWFPGLDSVTKKTDGYWGLNHPPSFNTDPFGYALSQNLEKHIKTWTKPYDRPRGFIPTRENKGQWTAAQVRQIRFFGAITEQAFWDNRA